MRLCSQIVTGDEHWQTATGPAHPQIGPDGLRSPFGHILGTIRPTPTCALWAHIMLPAFHIERGDLLDILEHPNPERDGGKRIFVVRREDDVNLVPFVEDEHTVFLKTIIPSRLKEV